MLEKKIIDHIYLVSHGKSLPPKDTTFNGIGSIIATVQERIPRALVAPTLAVERSVEIKPKNRN